MDQERTTEIILGAAMEVSNVLGAGFLERVYRRALGVELRMRGVSVEEEARFRVTYKSLCVGEYVADLVHVCHDLPLSPSTSLINIGVNRHVAESVVPNILRYSRFSH